MTISTQSSQVTLLGNGATTVFTFPFVGAAASDIQVTYTDATGAQTILLTSQYALILNAPAVGQLWGAGGSVTYPTSGPAIANGTSLTISRIVPLTQTVTISDQGDFSPQVIEQAMDLLELQIQQVSARGGAQRGIWATGNTYNFGDIVVDGANGANTQNFYTCAIANVSGVWATDLANGDWTLAINIQAIAGYATSAAASAATATTEAGIATTQAGIATAQASIATTQAANASSSASASAASAATATTQATNASNSASTATTQAGIATTQATNASTSASTATTQAGIATTQATNAANSASAASTSATNAANSASAAATSAIVAGSTLSATSTTSNTIGTGNFTFIVQANKNFFPGQPVIAASNANGANYIHGIINSYSGTTLIITEQDNSGSGTHADWNISVTGTQGPSGGGTGTVTTVSVVTANGVSGTVANPTTTPTITLTATPNGILKSNGTTMSAATAGTDYVIPSGNVATLTTGRTISITGDISYTSPAFNGSSNLTSAGTLATVNSNVGSFTNASITVNAKGLVTAASEGVSAVVSINRQTFPSSGTYTPSPGMVYADIEVWGGGGGGGGATSTPGRVGAGGGAGGYAKKVVSAATIGASKSVTIGAGGTAGANTGGTGGTGGTTSVGSVIVQATGGAGGVGLSIQGIALGGAGGVGSGGDVNTTGTSGNIGIDNNTVNISGGGGNTSLGSAGYGQDFTANAVGISAVANSGSGGGGAAADGTARVGGVGGSGYVVITEYCSQ